MDSSVGYVVQLCFQISFQITTNAFRYGLIQTKMLFSLLVGNKTQQILCVYLFWYLMIDGTLTKQLIFKMLIIINSTIGKQDCCVLILIGRMFYKAMPHWRSKCCFTENWLKPRQQSNFNSLSPGKCGCDFKCVDFHCNLGTGMLSIQINFTLRWMPEDHTNGKSELIQVMAWWCQVASHYMSQCWPRPLSSYAVTIS